MAPLKVLHALSQRPEMTGSGIYVESLIKQSEMRGLSNYRLAAMPMAEYHSPTRRSNTGGSLVFFESETLNFPIPGMSDVMPYNSSLFKDLKGMRLRAYKTAFAQALKAAVSDFQPDIIHSNHLFLLSALIRMLFPDLPVVATCHGTDLRQYQNCPHLRCFVLHFCKKLDRVIALTGDQQQEISRVLRIPGRKISVVGGGFDENIFSRAAKPPPRPVQLLYAGKFNRSKGLPWLLKSLARIRTHDWHLHLAGGGKGREFDLSLELAARLGSKVTNHGYVDHQRLAELMKQAHIQVLPSFFEGLPLVLFEGLASGCRIITTHLPGFHEIFGNAKADTVRLIQLPPLETIDKPYPKDEAALEDALCSSILEMMEAAKQSPDLDDPEADNISARYTWPQIFQRTLAVYREVMH